MSTSDTTFKETVYRAFPDHSSARAARFAEVAQRTMQKWMSSESDVPGPIREALSEQADLVEKSAITEKIGALVSDFLDAGGDPEVVGSVLSAEFQKVLGKPI